VTSVAWTFPQGVHVGPIPPLPSAGTVRRVRRVRRRRRLSSPRTGAPPPPRVNGSSPLPTRQTVLTVLCSSTDHSSAQPAPSAGASRVRKVRDDAPECVKGRDRRSRQSGGACHPASARTRGRDGRATRTGRRGRCRHRRAGVTSARYLPVCPGRRCCCRRAGVAVGRASDVHRELAPRASVGQRGRCVNSSATAGTSATTCSPSAASTRYQGARPRCSRRWRRRVRRAAG
jgi:hypothetical protein